MNRRKASTTAASPLGLTIVGRIAQALALVAVVVGVLFMGPVANEIARWRSGAGTFHDVYLAWLPSSLPIVFGVLFGAAVEHSLRRRSRISRSLIESPAEPWLADPRWRTKTLRLSSRSAIVGYAIFLVLFVVYLVPLPWAFDWPPLKWVVVGIGVFAALFAWGQWRQRRWHAAELRLETLPGVIGGPLVGVFVIDRTFPPGTIFDASLRCTHLATRGEDQADVRETAWSETLRIGRTLRSDRPDSTAVPISFAIPFDVSPTDLLDEPERTPRAVEWKVTVQVLDRPDLGSSTFDVPVFRTSESRSDYAHDEALLEDYLHVEDVATILARDGYEETRTRDGWPEIVLYRRDRGVFLAVTIVGGGSVAAIAASVYFIQDGPLVWFLCLIPGVLVLACVRGLLDRFFWKCSIVVHEERLDVTCGLLGFRKRFTFARGDGARLECAIYSRTNQSENWKIDLRGQKRVAAHIVRGLASRNEAERVQRWLAERIGATVVEPTVERP